MKKKIFYFILAILAVGFSMYCIKTNYAQQNNTTGWVGKEKWIEGKPNVLLHSLSCIVTVTVKIMPTDHIISKLVKGTQQKVD